MRDAARPETGGAVKSRKASTGGVVALSLALAGCVSLPKDAGLSDVQDAVRERSGLTVKRIGQDGDAEAAERLRVLLGGDVSENEAVEIALLNNRRFQALLEELGIGRADLWQAGLPRNPVLGGEIRFPGSPSAPFEVFLLQNVIDLIRLPQRRRQAAAEFEHTKLRVADEVLDLVSRVRRAYFTAQAASQAVALRRTVTELAQATVELAIRQHAAGNISDLQLEQEQALLEQAKLEQALGEEDELAERERLTSLMGLWGEHLNWRIGPTLPELPEREADLQGLESRAAVNRLDLALARGEVEVLARALPHSRLAALDLEVGVHREREPDGKTTTGPALDISLPVFDRGGPARSRAEASLRQAQARLTALAVEIRSEVRAGRQRLLAARNRALYFETVVLPRRARIVAFTQQEYNFMLIGPFQLFAARQDEIDAQRQRIESLRDYWISRADLERTLGGRLTTTDGGEQP